MLQAMKLGAILGRDAVDKIERVVEKAEEREAMKKRDREIARKRRLGKTIRYSRED